MSNSLENSQARRLSVKEVKGDAEVVPDSEEERFRGVEGISKSDVQPRVEVIEIFSSDEEIEHDRTADIEDDPFMVKIPGSWPTNKSHISPKTKGPVKANRKFQPPGSRRIIQSSSSERSESDSSPRRTEPEVPDSSPDRSKKKTNGKHLIPSRPTLKNASRSAPEPVMPLYADEDEHWNVDDGSILALNLPGTLRKPIRRAPTFPNGSLKHCSIIPVTPSESAGIVDLDSDEDSVLPSAATSSSRTRRTPRGALQTTKKAQVATEQARREQYAADLFEELNRVVFKDGLPKETKMNWNKRLLSTAGRAKWHRSRDGVHSTEIELATKILDNDERIRNTLSHEMCHLACWIINGDPKEGHGKVWKGWAAKVERKRTDIEVTTKHNYEISYPYEWECEQCAKVYGRFSKSIRPDECVCGACKVGKLIPLFTQAAPRTPKTKAGSRMAPEKTQGSPRSIAPPHPLERGKGTIVSHRTPGLGQKVYSAKTFDSDSDLEILTTSLSAAKI